MQLLFSHSPWDRVLLCPWDSLSCRLNSTLVTIFLLFLPPLILPFFLQGPDARSEAPPPNHSPSSLPLVQCLICTSAQRITWLHSAESKPNGTSHVEPPWLPRKDQARPRNPLAPPQLLSVARDGEKNANRTKTALHRCTATALIETSQGNSTPCSSVFTIYCFWGSPLRRAETPYPLNNR